jgi:hypothetical protein
MGAVGELKPAVAKGQTAQTILYFLSSFAIMWKIESLFFSKPKNPQACTIWFTVAGSNTSLSPSDPPSRTILPACNSELHLGLDTDGCSYIPTAYPGILCEFHAQSNTDSLQRSLYLTISEAIAVVRLPVVTASPASCSGDVVGDSRLRLFILTDIHDCIQTRRPLLVYDPVICPIFRNVIPYFDTQSKKLRK